MADSNLRRVHCNRCGNYTNHFVLHQEICKLPEDDGPSEYGTYSMLKCCGCEDIHYLSETWCSEASDGEASKTAMIDKVIALMGDAPTMATIATIAAIEWQYAIDITTRRYPPAMSRRHPDWWYGFSAYLPKDINDFLKEIYVALHNDSLRLCALGIRALIETIILEKIPEDTGKLSRNIDAFFAAGYVAPNERDQFRDKVIELGNAAMHRSYKPESRDVYFLLDITESLIASIFVHPIRARNVGTKMPSRPSKVLRFPIKVVEQTDGGREASDAP
jgi:hypothetical protein